MRTGGEDRLPLEANLSSRKRSVSIGVWKRAYGKLQWSSLKFSRYPKVPMKGFGRYLRSSLGSHRSVSGADTPRRSERTSSKMLVFRVRLHVHIISKVWSVTSVAMERWSLDIRMTETFVPKRKRTRSTSLKMTTERARSHVCRLNGAHLKNVVK